MGEPPASVVSSPPPPVASVGRAVAACALYGTSSVAITFFNKAVFAVYHFHYPVFMTLVQILFCLATLRVANALGLCVFGGGEGVSLFGVLLWGMGKGASEGRRVGRVAGLFGGGEVAVWPIEALSLQTTFMSCF